jgi:hypothetical protein
VIVFCSVKFIVFIELQVILNHRAASVVGWRLLAACSLAFAPKVCLLPGFFLKLVSIAALMMVYGLS